MMSIFLQAVMILAKLMVITLPLWLVVISISWFNKFELLEKVSRMIAFTNLGLLFAIAMATFVFVVWSM